MAPPLSGALDCLSFCPLVCFLVGLHDKVRLPATPPTYVFFVCVYLLCVAAWMLPEHAQSAAAAAPLPSTNYVPSPSSPPSPLLSLLPGNMTCDQATQRDNVKCPESLPAELAAPSQDISFLFIYVVFGPRDLHEATAWT